MQLERFPPNDPREWLNRARGNLALARVEPSGVYREDLCFNAQQAAEKAIKGLLLHRGIPFPYIHDLAELLRLLEREGEDIPSRVRDAQQLTDYAVETRYPGTAEPVSEEEYEEALALAEEVVRWAEERLQSQEDKGETE